MSLLPQPYRSNKRLAQLIKQEPKSIAQPLKPVQITTSPIIQTRQSNVKIESTTHVQNTRSKSTQKDINSTKPQYKVEPQNLTTKRISQIQKEPIVETKQKHTRATSNVSMKSQNEQIIQIQSQKQQKKESEPLTQSKKRGYQESLITANQQVKVAQKINKDSKKVEPENTKQKSQQAQIQDIDLDDLLSSQKTVKRCTKSKAKELVKEEKYQTQTSQYESKTKRQKICHQTPQSLTQITSSHSQIETRSSRSKTPKYDQNYYTQTTSKCSRSKNFLKDEPLILSSQAINVIKDAHKIIQKQKPATQNKKQSIKIETSDFDLSDLLQSTKTSQKTIVSKNTKQQNSQKPTSRERSKSMSQSNKGYISEKNTQISTKTEKVKQPPIESQNLTQTQRQTRSSKLQNKLTSNDVQNNNSQSPQLFNDKQQSSQKSKKHDSQKDSKQSRNQSGSKNQSSILSQKIQDLTKLNQSQDIMMKEDNDNHYEQMTCSQLIEEVLSVKKEQKKLNEMQNTVVSSFTVDQEELQCTSNKYQDELILFSNVKQEPILKEPFKKQAQQRHIPILITQTQSELELEEPMEIDMLQYDADQSQACVKYTQKYSVKDIKKTLQQKMQSPQAKKLSQNDLDILKLERELDTFEKKQISNRNVVLQKPLEMIIPRNATPTLQSQNNSQFIIPQATEQQIKRTPTSIYNHAPIAFIKQDILQQTKPAAVSNSAKNQNNEEVKQGQSILNAVNSAKSLNISDSVNSIDKQIQPVFSMNIPTKETLDLIRRAYSNKPTPTQNMPLSFNNFYNATSTPGGIPIRYSSSSSKRINSDKPTPCLSTKLSELRNQHNINGGILLGSFQNQNNYMSDAISNVGNNGTHSKYNGQSYQNGNNINEQSLSHTTPRQQGFNMSNIQSEIITPYKDRFERATREEEQAKNIQAKIEETKQPVQQHYLNPQILAQKLKEKQQINKVINLIKEERRQDIRENSQGKQTIDLTKDEDILMIDEQKQNQHTDLEIQTQKILNGISMSEKYADLIDTNNNQLILPAHYKQLLTTFTYLDQTINFIKSRNQSLTFSTIQKTMQQQTKKAFTQIHFAQILFVVPYMFNHKWEQKARGFELMIEIPKNIRQLLNKIEKIPSNDSFDEMILQDLRDLRRKVFQDRLLQITFKHYQKSKEKLMDVPKYADLISLIDPLKQNQWPIFFDPHSVPEIPKSSLKEQPKQSKSQTVAEFINITNINRQSLPIQQQQPVLNNNTEQQLLKDNLLTKDILIEKGKDSPTAVQLQTQYNNDTFMNDDCNQTTSTLATSNTTARQYNTSTSSRLLDAHLYLSQDLIAKIKSKQNRVEHLKQLNQDYMDRQEQNKIIESYSVIIKTISMQFVTKTTNVMPMKELLIILDDRQRGRFNSKEQLIEQITQIAQILPEFIQLFNSPMGGQHIKIKNKKIQIADLTSKLEQYLKANELLLQSHLNQPQKQNIEINNAHLV